ncbi:MAG: SET domain-containing protein-lysine N-methyltransferase [Nanoarchaeota archaeon]
MIKNKNILIKRSKIHGYGIFANKDFKKGEVVIKWDISKSLNERKINKLPKKEKKYVNKINGRYFLMQSPERYVNHSCNPNTYVRNFSDIAKKNIKIGKEILTNYNKIGEILGSKIICNCKSKNCRGFIKL